MYARFLGIVFFGVSAVTAQPMQPPGEPGFPAPKADPASAPLDRVRLRLGSELFRESNYITSVTLAADCKTMAVSNGSLLVRILELPSGKELRRFQIREHLRSEHTFFTPDGKHFLTPGYSGIYVWDTADGKAVKTITTNNNNNNRDGPMQMSADGKWIVIGSQYESGSVRVVNLSDGATTATFKPLQNSYLHGTINSDGTTVATWGQHYNRGVAGEDYQTIARTVELWNVKEAKQVGKLLTDSSAMQSAKFSPDGKKLATAGNGVVQIWDVATAKMERRFAARSGIGFHVTFSPDGKTVSAAGSDGGVQSWDVTTGKRLGICEGRMLQVRGMTHRPDGQLLAWSWNTNAIDLWEAPSGKRLTPEGGHTTPVTAFQFSADRKSLLSSGGDGKVLRWDAQTGKELPLFEPKTTNVLRPFGYNQSYSAMVHFSPNGKYIISASGTSNTAALWEVDSNLELFALTGPRGYVDRNGLMAFSPDSTKLVASNRYNNREQGAIIPVWDVESGSPLPDCKGQKGDLNCAAFSTDGNLLVTCSYAYQPTGGALGEAWCWDVATGRNLAKVTVPNITFTKVQFIDHRLFVLLGNGSQPLKIYDAVTGQEMRMLDGTAYGGGVVLTLSPDRRLLAAAAQEGPDRVGPNGYPIPGKKKIIVWEVASGSVRAEYTVGESPIMAATFSADGKTLAVGANNTSISLIDLQTPAPKVDALKPSDLTAGWAMLDDKSARKAYETMQKLAARPADAVPFLKEQLKPITVTKPDPAKIAKLIEDLDAARYVVRETATRDLELMGRHAKSAVEEALKKNPSPEMRDRLEKLIVRVNKPDTGTEWVRALRAIEVLEQIGTPEALAHLKELANGGDAPPTRMAKEAVARMAK